jgi:hypothetical protein
MITLSWGMEIILNRDVVAKTRNYEGPLRLQGHIVI